MCGCFSHALYWGPGWQPRHVPWLGTELPTLVHSPCSIHWATPVLKKKKILKSDSYLVSCHRHSRKQISSPSLSPLFPYLLSPLEYWCNPRVQNWTLHSSHANTPCASSDIPRAWSRTWGWPPNFYLEFSPLWILEPHILLLFGYFHPLQCLLVTTNSVL